LRCKGSGEIWPYVGDFQGKEKKRSEMYQHATERQKREREAKNSRHKPTEGEEEVRSIGITTF
jgi:hypothetical protein